MENNSILEDLFSAEIMKWRYWKSLILSLSLQLIVTTIVSSALQLALFDVTLNPISWIYCFILGIIQPSWLLKIPIPAICYTALTRIHLHSYSVSPWIAERRLHYFVQLFHPKKILHAVGFIAVISFLFKHYVSLVRPSYSSLTIPCEDNNSICINQQSILMWILGLVIGIRFTLKYFMHNHNCIHFGPAQVPLVVRMKSKFSLRLVTESCSLYDIGPQLFISVCLIYGLLGTVISQWLTSTFSLSQSNEFHSAWIVISHLFDVRFMATLVICSMLLAYNLHCYLLIFQEMITEKIQLPLNESDSITETQGTSSQWTLANALVSSGSLLQMLAFKQLKDVALEYTHFGQHFRARIFAISQPGGHPRNWLLIANPSLNLIRNFCSRLKQVNHLEDRDRLTMLPPGSGLTDLNKNNVPKDAPIINSRWNQLKEYVKRFPLFSFLLSEFPDVQNRRIFAQSQSVIWAIEGLSNLVAASFENDQYGVVQKNIGDILTALVHLQMIMDKVGRGLPYRKGSNFGSRIVKSPRDHQLRRSLRLTLRSSLYIITNTFKESIREIPLEDNIRIKLDSYLNFQET